MSNISHVLSPLVARGIKQILCDATGKGLLEAASDSPGLAHVPFPFVDFA